MLVEMRHLSIRLVVVGSGGDLSAAMVRFLREAPLTQLSYSVSFSIRKRTVELSYPPSQLESFGVHSVAMEYVFTLYSM